MMAAPKYRMRLSDIFNRVLFEGPETQSGLARIADYWLSAAADHCAKALKSSLSNGVPLAELDPHDMGGVVLRDMPRARIKTLEAGLQGFVKEMQERWLVLRFSPPVTRRGVSYDGWYRGTKQPEITLIITDKEVAYLRSLAAEDRLTLYALGHLLRDHRDTLIHELRHAYDDWDSDGRYHDNAQSRAARAANADAGDDPAKQAAAFGLYQNDPVEISARYTQVVSEIERDRLRTSWPDYRRQFQYAFTGWRNVSPEVQRRLLTRLAAHWQVDRQMFKPDVEGAVARLQKRLGSVARVRLVAGDKAISVENVTVKQPEAITALLKPIALLADHYGLTIALADKLPIPAVRPLKFLNQRPRSPNGGKRDYSLPLDTVYLRRPEQRRAT